MGGLHLLLLGLRGSPVVSPVVLPARLPVGSAPMGMIPAWLRQRQPVLVLFPAWSALLRLPVVLLRLPVWFLRRLLVAVAVAARGTLMKHGRNIRGFTRMQVSMR